MDNISDAAVDTTATVAASQRGWWLSLYPRLSPRARRRLAAACMATVLLAQSIAGVRGQGSGDSVAPAADPYANPAVQNAMRQLGLNAPAANQSPAAPDSPASPFAPAALDNTPTGSQFQVNTYTTNQQAAPSVALDSDGDFVVVWQSYGSSGGDTSGNSIQGQRYNSVGTAQGSQFQVNTYTTNAQSYSSVALDTDGDFVVVWQSNGSSGGDTSLYSVQGQRYNSVGTAQGSQFQVNTYTTGDQSNASVALDADGDFVVVWNGPGTGDTGGGIQAQRYNSVGTAQGANFLVNSYTTGSQVTPSVALDSDGDFVVVWTSNGSSGGDISLYSVQGQRYNSVGTAQGSQFQVNTYTTGRQFSPSVALDSDGDFAVVWQSNGSSGGDTSDYSVQGQRYNSVGTAQGSQFQVNSYTTDVQRFPSVALDSDGDFVVVWQSFGSNVGDTITNSVQGQRYNSVGTAQGSQFQVNTYTTSHQLVPSVALDADGDFVVVWSSGGSSGGDTSFNSVQGQRFLSAVTTVQSGNQFQVNTYTTRLQGYPSVALDSDGDFVVVWTSNGSSGGDTSSYSIQGQRYNSVGTAQGSQFQVNTYTTGDQQLPSVALDSDGDFVVVWQSNGSSGGDTSSYSVQGQRYNSVGTAQGSQFQVNTYTTSLQGSPYVALDSDGDFVVGWTSYGSSGGDTSSYSVQGQRYNSVGTAQGSQFQVNSYTTNDQRYSFVALDTDGDFVVVWQSYGSSGGDTSLNSVQGQRYNSVGTAQGSQFQVNSYTTNDQRIPAVSLDSDGDFAVVWQSNGSSGGDTSGNSIQGQRYNSVGTAQGSQFQVNTYTTNVQQMPSVALDADGDFAVVWQSNGSAGSDSIQYSIQGRTFRKDGRALQGEFQVNAVTFGNQQQSAVAIDANGDFVVAWHGYSNAGTDFDSSIQAALFDLGQSDYQVNEYTTGNQQVPSVALDADGDFVVVWQSYGSSGTDTSSYSIQGQRFNSVGQAHGSQFQVNTYTSARQQVPSVALDADGDFVVVWRSYGSSGTDTDSYSIQGQRYNSVGTTQGSQFQVNSYTTNDQRIPAVSLDTDGDFVVVWESNGSSGGDTSLNSIQGQRYNSVGTAQGSQFQVNTYTTNVQQVPSVALDADGDFVVVWTSDGSSGGDTSNSIQAQRYNSVGTAQGSQFQVNTYTMNNQDYPSVALDSDGDFVVVWHSYGSSGGDTSYYSVQGQRYNSVGTAQGSQFQVNTYTTSGQFFPSVSLDTDGDFVVVWESAGSSGGDTDSGSIQGQRYNSVGTAQGSQFQVNTYTTNSQAGASVALDSDGDFVVVWTSNGVSDPPGPALLFEAMAPDSPLAPNSPAGLAADPNYGIAAARFQAQGGPAPTAVTLQAFTAEAAGGGLAAALAALGAAVGAWWWRVRRVRERAGNRLRSIMR